jgi:hypothetical protein
MDLLSSDILKYALITKLDNNTLFVCRQVCKKFKQYISNNKFSIRKAIRYGYLNLVIWASTQGCAINRLTACSSAAKYGHLRILQWLNVNIYSMPNIFISNKVSENAALYGYLNILQWLTDNNYSISDRVCINAAKGGHLHILRWARLHNCLLTPESCSNAAMSGHLEILQWLRNEECPWDKWTVIGAILNGHLEVLKWVLMNGCPSEIYLDIDTSIAAKKYPEIEQFLQNNKFILAPTSIFE